MLIIAYVNEAPEASQLTGFIQMYTINSKEANVRQQLESVKNSNATIVAAYDAETLIAIGIRLSEDLQHNNEISCIYVLPAYEYRGIASNVKKLLQAERELRPKAVFSV